MPTNEADAWMDGAEHRQWLARQTNALFDFYARGAPDRVDGGFWWVDGTGEPVVSRGKQLWINTRMTYAFTLGGLLDRDGAAALAQRGLQYLQRGPLYDATNGGWFWAVDEHGEPVEDTKQAYGHAFVLLAAAAGRVAGLDVGTLWDDARRILDEKFWDDAQGAFVDTWDHEFTELENYRGQNANMHLVEASMLAAEVTGETTYLDRGRRVAEKLIRDITAGNGGRLPEHFDEKWTILPDYGTDSDNVFRPFGSTVGHWLEWARLLLQLRLQLQAHDGAADWMASSAAALFDRAIEEGWDEENGGFVFSVDWNGRPADGDRYHWVITEAIGAAVALYRTTGDRRYDTWYRTFWEYAQQHLIDPDDGSWAHQLDEHNAPSSDAWDGKPDLYHVLQSTLYARVPFGGSIILHLASGGIDR